MKHKLLQNDEKHSTKAWNKKNYIEECRSEKETSTSPKHQSLITLLTVSDIERT